MLTTKSARKMRRSARKMRRSARKTTRNSGRKNTCTHNAGSSNAGSSNAGSSNAGSSNAGSSYPIGYHSSNPINRLKNRLRSQGTHDIGPFYVNNRVADAFPSTLSWNPLSRHIDRNAREQEQLRERVRINDAEARQRRLREAYERSIETQERYSQKYRQQEQPQGILQRIMNFFRPSKDHSDQIRHHSPRRN
jgi:hypothetical protein